MSTTAILAIVIPVLVVLAAAVLFTAARRRDARGATGALSRETVKRDRGDSAALPEAEEVALRGKDYEKAAVEVGGTGTALAVAEKASVPVAYVPPADEETVGVSRRQFFNRGIVALMILGLSGFGAAVIAFLWPQLKGGFGSKIRVGKLEDVQQAIEAGGGFYYVPEGRAWLTAYPAEALPKAEAVYPPPVLAGMREGINALYQKCPHLGCRVPECPTSKWFECPCHGSQYNAAGEKKAGPAPRGMDHFAVSVDGGVVTVDTGAVIPGPPIGTNTTGQEAEGPHCLSGKAE